MIFIEKDEEILICNYYSENPRKSAMEIASDIVDSGSISNSKIICNTFLVNKSNLIEDRDGDYLTFKIGELHEDFYLIDKNTIRVKYNLYIDKDINITKRKNNYFCIHGRISVMDKIFDIIEQDLYIHKKLDTDYEDAGAIHISENTFNKIVKILPTTREFELYTKKRLEAILSEHLIEPFKFKDKYNKFLSKKEKGLSSNDIDVFKPLKHELLLATYNKLKNMLDNYDGYTEPNWQAEINDVLCVIFPKYIYSLREVNFGKNWFFDKNPDFTLIDGNGFIDVMEIKKPDSNQIMRQARIRNNYVPQKIFIDTVTQISKYIDTACKNETEVKKDIIKKLNEKNIFTFNEDNLYVNNPKGYLLFGRSNELTPDMMYDYQLIKRQFKDVVEIMTYDELLAMIENLLKALS